MDTLLGLPAHPLIVHAAVVLLPLAALGVVLVAVSPKLRAKYVVPVVWLAALAAGVMPLASESGEALMRHVEFTAATKSHVQLGESGTAAGVAVLVAALAMLWLQRRGRRGRRPRRLFARIVLVLAVVVSVLATAQIARIGHSGATSVWQGVAEKIAQDVPAEDDE